VGADWFPGLDEQASGAWLDDGTLRPVGDALTSIVASVIPASLNATHEIGTIHLRLDGDSGDSGHIMVRLFPRPETLVTAGDRLEAIRLQPLPWWGWELTPGGQEISAGVMAHAKASILRSLIIECAHPSLLCCPRAAAALHHRDAVTRSIVKAALGQRGLHPDDPF
jgi:hypothetical protein